MNERTRHFAIFREIGCVLLSSIRICDNMFLCILCRRTGSPFRAYSEHSIHAINGMTSLRTKQLKLVNYEKYETTPANYNYFENAFDYTSNCSPYFSILLHDDTVDFVLKLKHSFNNSIAYLWTEIKFKLNALIWIDKIAGLRIKYHLELTAEWP